MNHPTSFKLDEHKLFMNKSIAFTHVDMAEQLTKHLKENGYPVGVKNIDQLDEDAFAEARSNTFGASDAAVLLGVAYSSKKVPMKTPMDLLAEKINKDWDPSIGMKASVRKGRELEPLILDKIQNIIEGEVIKPRHMYISENGDGLATNFDGVVFENSTTADDMFIDNYIPVPMEVKVCSFFGRSNYDWNKGISEFEPDPLHELAKRKEFPIHPTDDVTEHIIRKSDAIGIPKYYYTQLQQQMMFLDAPHGYLAVMDDIDWTLYFYYVPRDEFVINELGKKAHEMYQYLLKH